MAQRLRVDLPPGAAERVTGGVLAELAVVYRAVVDEVIAKLAGGAARGGVGQPKANFGAFPAGAAVAPAGRGQHVVGEASGLVLGAPGEVDLPRAFRTAYLRLIYAVDCRSTYSSRTCRGLRY
jgi:hypothetical protein